LEFGIKTLFLFIITSVKIGSRDGLVGIAAGFGLDGQRVGVRVSVGARFFSSPHHPDQFWGPSSLLSRGYWGIFFWG
jgi:hypothetical protein